MEIDMSNDLALVNNADEKLENFSKSKAAYFRLIIAIFGSVPWVGGFIAGLSALSAEREQAKVNQTLQLWMREHENKLNELKSDVLDIIERIDELGETAQKRISDDEYLVLVKQGFKVWDKSATRAKKEHIKKLLTNAAGTSLREDDIVRLFIEWIDKYHEVHFAIMREVYQSPGISRLGIWQAIRGGELPREDSSDADLFRMLIHDLNTGRIIRQSRMVEPYSGRFMKKTQTQKRPKSPYMKSSFDDVDPYELSELGKEFVHYVLSDAVKRLD